jgi:diaminopimelate epimerase
VTAGVPVVKLNGTGNEFVVVDEREQRIDDHVAFAKRVCDRTHGIGADGVLFVRPPDRPGDHTARVDIVNADGSAAEMCGNGMRCVARYLDADGSHPFAVLETQAGLISTTVLDRDPYRVMISMQEPAIGARYRIGTFDAVDVDLGNPHTVVFVDDFSQVDLPVDGPRIERDARYPHGTNVHFVRRDGDRWRVLHWERGAGATQACGTGAVAVAAVLITDGLAGEWVESASQTRVTLDVPGGVLEVGWTPGQRAVLIGDAVREFDQIVR